MDGKIVQDVVPPQRRSIRNIPLPSNKKISQTQTPVDNGENNIPTPPTPPPAPPKGPIPPRKRGLGNKFVWGGIIVAVLLVIFGVLSFFDSASITVTPRSENVNVNQTFTASRSEDGSGIPYQTVRVSGESGKVVPASEGEFVESKASGTIIIYNEYSEEPQKLIANTRFESEDGLIYRIKDPITVPGEKDGKSGSIEVTVFADEPGSEYNKASATFTIPGLEGDPRFEAFSAETKTALSGGFSGTAKKVESEIKEEARIELQDELIEKLTTEAQATIPDEFIMVPDAISLTFSELPQTDAQESSVKINERLVLEAVIFNKDVLNDAILGVVFKEAQGKATITNLEDLSFEVPEDTSDTFQFTISGNVNIIWDVSEDELREALEGAKQNNLNNILSNFPSIKRAEAKIKPFWKGSFPQNGDEIEVTFDL